MPDAEDAVQELFAKMASRQLLLPLAKLPAPAQTAHLATRMKCHFVNRWREGHCLRRGGGMTSVPLMRACAHTSTYLARIMRRLILGESAGVAASMAAKAHLPVQQIEYAQLRTKLLARKPKIETPVKYPCFHHHHYLR